VADNHGQMLWGDEPRQRDTIMIPPQLRIEFRQISDFGRGVEMLWGQVQSLDPTDYAHYLVAVYSYRRPTEWTFEGLVPLSGAGSFACDLRASLGDEKSGVAAYLLRTVTKLEAPLAPLLPME
jgi:hypothetical protein